MRLLRWGLYAWPGLPDLWWRGAWSGLAVACCFALLASFVVTATVVWDELLGPHLGGSIWTGFAAGWLALLFVSLRTAPQASDDSLAGAGDLFPAALAEYLRGNWLEAELAARQLLVRGPSDVEAALLLAAALRHTNRFDEARETLDTATQWDRASGWQLELEAEYERLTAKQSRQTAEESAGSPPPQTPGSEQMERNVHLIESNAETLPDWRDVA